LIYAVRTGTSGVLGCREYIAAFAPAFSLMVFCFDVGQSSV
jgi:hypothetical protein